jgi:cytochrome P450
MRVEQVAIPMIRAVVNRPKLADVLFRFDPWGNPLGKDRYEYPYPIFDRVRADGPVNYRRLYLQWFVVGHEEARTAFSSNKMIVTPQRETMLAVRPFSQLGENATAFVNNLLILIDPPDHTRLRKLVSRAFSPRQVARIEAAVTKLVEVRIDGLLERSGPDREPVDLFEHFIEPLPVNVICELLGIPEDRWAWAADISRMISLLGNVMVGFDPKPVSEALDDLRDYVLDLGQQRRLDPQDDLISELVAVDEDGDRLSDDEYVGMVGILLFAGHETTSGLLGNSIIALAKHPEQRELVRDTPALWDNAVEELLRWDSPVQAAARATTEPLEVGGKTIPGGSNVVVFPGAANRDPNFYDDPNVLRLDRPDPQPVSFGHGMHHCLGHALAKMETKTALRGFVEAFGDYTVETDAVTWKRSIVTRGPEHLPVRPG